MKPKIRVYENGNAMLIDAENTPESRGITETFTGPKGVLKQIDEVDATGKNLEQHFKLNKKQREEWEKRM